MKYTNKMRLPDPIVDAIINDDYDNGGTYSATTLLKSPKEIILSERHSEEIEEDVSDLAYSLLGTSVHYILEKSKLGEYDVAEERLHYNIGEDTISGKFDLYNMDTQMLSDYKVTSVSTYARGNFEKYRFQLLFYAFLLRKNGFGCKGGRIYQMFRDWQRERARQDPTYPQKFVNIIEFHFTERDYDWIYREIVEKLTAINICKNLDDDDIPICSKENRWAVGDKYAVMKDGNKRASKVFSTREDAENWIADSAGYSIVERPAVSIKCKNYCVCKKFCNFWRSNYSEGAMS